MTNPPEIRGAVQCRYGDSKRWIVKAGHTAKVRGDHDPVVRDTKGSAPNPWGSWE